MGVSRIMPNYKEATEHPTQKPEKLAERILLASSKEGDLVLIPFAGSGSEIVACVRNQRNFIATECNERYVQDIIFPRLEKTFGVEKFLMKTEKNGGMYIEYPISLYCPS